jgi:HK97 family phage portal protein
MANIFSRILNRNKKTEERSMFDEWTNPVYGTLSFSTFNSYTSSKALKLSTVYRCVNLLSDSIASLPLYPYKYKENWKYIVEDNLYNVLNVQPNPLQGRYTFLKEMIVNMLMKGNAYILITRMKDGTVERLDILDSDDTEVIIVDGTIKYRSISTKKIFDSSQIIHIMNYSVNGYVGVSTLTYAAETLSIAYESEQHTKNFFSAGASLSGILSPKDGVNLTKDRAARAKQDFINSLNSDLGGTSGGVVVLDSGLQYQPISISPEQSQLIQSRQYNVIDICRYFNVPPALAFDQNGKYATSEQQMLDFLNGTLTPMLEKIENEMFRKLFTQSEWLESDLRFDAENLLRLDATTRATYYTQMFNLGAYSTNEIREKINAKYPVQNGNKHFIQVNLQPLDNLAVQGNNNDNQE